MILPAALALGAALVLPVVDGVPNLNVEQVCDGIAKQGGFTFHDPSIDKEKKNCLGDRAVGARRAGQAMAELFRRGQSLLRQRIEDGRGVELYRAVDLP
jgi:hypothetical protein